MNDYIESIETTYSFCDVQPPPCERYPCEYLDKCKSEKVACEAFHWYVSTGKVVHPKTVWRKKKPMIYPYAEPTSGRYAIIYGNKAKSID